jgi:uncharacterized protein (TIGR02147 family)
VKQGFSFRLFAKNAGMKSPNYLQLVMKGTRSLTDSSAAQVATAMKLSPPERDYFVALVRHQNAKTHEEKSNAQKSLLIAIKKITSKEIPKTQAIVLSEWYHLVVREMTFLHNFTPSGEWISRRLRGLITPKEAEDSLKILLQSGFLVKEKTGKLIAKDPVIDTGDAFDFARVLENHSRTLDTWRRILSELSQEERELGLLNIPISKEKIPELKKRIRQFQEEIIGWIQDEKSPDQIVQLGTYLMPISTPGE